MTQAQALPTADQVSEAETTREPTSLRQKLFGTAATAAFFGGIYLTYKGYADISQAAHTPDLIKAYAESAQGIATAAGMSAITHNLGAKRVAIFALAAAAASVPVNYALNAADQFGTDIAQQRATERARIQALPKLAPDTVVHTIEVKAKDKVCRDPDVAGTTRTYVWNGKEFGVDCPAGPR